MYPLKFIIIDERWCSFEMERNLVMNLLLSKTYERWWGENGQVMFRSALNPKSQLSGWSNTFPELVRWVREISKQSRILFKLNHQSVSFPKCKLRVVYQISRKPNSWIHEIWLNFSCIQKRFTNRHSYHYRFKNNDRHTRNQSTVTKSKQNTGKCAGYSTTKMDSRWMKKYA